MHACQPHWPWRHGPRHAFLAGSPSRKLQPFESEKLTRRSYPERACAGCAVRRPLPALEQRDEHEGVLRPARWQHQARHPACPGPAAGNEGGGRLGGRGIDFTSRHSRDTYTCEHYIRMLTFVKNTVESRPGGGYSCCSISKGSASRAVITVGSSGYDALPAGYHVSCWAT